MGAGTVYIYICMYIYLFIYLYIHIHICTFALLDPACGPTCLYPLIWKRGGAGYLSLVRGSKKQPARSYSGRLPPTYVGHPSCVAWNCLFSFLFFSFVGAVTCLS